MTLPNELAKEAARVQPGELLSWLLTLPLFLPAWLVGLLARLLWYVVAYTIGAVKLGVKKGWNAL